MSEVTLPDLDSIPTQPPPPAPAAEQTYTAPRVRRPKRSGGRLWRIAVLILACQGALVTSAVLVAVERPSVAWAVAAVGLTDVFMVVAFTMMLGMLGRAR